LPGPILHDAVIAGRALPEAAVGSMPVVVLDVLAQELFELPVVPDQGAVEEPPANGADPAFRVRVRDRRAWWRADDCRLVAAEDLVERGEVWPARSRIRNRIVRSYRIMRFRAVWVVQAPVGLVVMPARCTRRRSSSMKNPTE
jgi:hypothetical protein